MAVLSIEKITLDAFRTTLSRYPDVAPTSLRELDTFRYETVPTKLASMKVDKHLLKVDVEKLVEWKLKHGTFRPSLMNLVKSNPADLIRSATTSAFSIFDKSKDAKQALKELTKLRGIGPATASLLLSVYQPDTVPFFSDELFRWTHWDGTGAAAVAGKNKPGEGWERKIKYNVKEYEGVIERVASLRKRLGVGATEAEKLAYVLGKEMADVDGGPNEQKLKSGGMDEREEKQSSDRKSEVTVEEDKDRRMTDITKAIRDAEAEAKSGKKGKGDVKSTKAQAETDTQKKGAKRKAQEQQAFTEGPRKSTRRK